VQVVHDDFWFDTQKLLHTSDRIGEGAKDLEVLQIADVRTQKSRVVEADAKGVL
jgi:hypothetical protein